MTLLITFMFENADSILTSQKTKTQLQTSFFSGYAFPTSDGFGYKSIDGSSSIKGILKDSSGKSIANRDVFIFVDQIKMGVVTTDEDGCFYFKNWDNDKLKSLIDDNRHNSFFRVKMSTTFNGDDTLDKSVASTRVTIYNMPPLLPEPVFKVVQNNDTKETTLQAGESTHIPVSILSQVKGITAEKLGVTLDQLPCKGINGSIVIHGSNTLTPQNEVNATIFLSTDNNVVPGTYTLKITGHGIFHSNATQVQEGSWVFGTLYLNIR